MISDAVKKAGLSAENHPVEGVAQSISIPFHIINQAVDLAIPLRRPSRREPSVEVERQFFATIIARDAEYLEELNPKGNALDALVAKFPAPLEWYKED